MYAEGKGVPQDDVEAAKWHRRAADAGMLMPNIIWGCCMLMGEALRRIIKKQRSGIALQLRRGNTNAQLVLGLLYYSGKGVMQDYAEAAKWLHLAAKAGNADAQCNLGMMYGKG